MNWTFPRIKLERTEDQQVAKIAEEVAEFVTEVGEHAKDLEALDIYHAAETLLRKRFADREVELDNLVEEVIAKNTRRGKY